MNQNRVKAIAGVSVAGLLLARASGTPESDLAAFFQFLLVCYSVALAAAIQLVAFEPRPSVPEPNSGIARTVCGGVFLLLLAHALLSKP